MTENLLYLCPVDIHAVPPDLQAMLVGLLSAEFIAEPIEFGGESHYRPGSRFISYITFLGCSPVISTQDNGDAGEGFSHIAIEGPLPSPRFVGGDNLKTPRCPSCGHRFEEWSSIVEKPVSHSFNCPECDRSLTAPQLRWRKCAGFGRIFMKVWGIFESEAVPSPEFLALLEQLSGCRWQHFYVRYLD